MPQWRPAALNLAMPWQDRPVSEWPAERSGPGVTGFDDVTEQQLRERADVNWAVAPDDVLPAWVAETDYAPSPAVLHAVHEVTRLGRFGYPSPAAVDRLRRATAGFAVARFGWEFDPALVVATGDVMAGVMLAVQTLCDPGPVVVPTPAYPPFLAAIPLTGRELVTVRLDPDAERAELDLDGIEAALADGARTVLLCNPHNPWGRAWSPPELAGLRDVVVRHGARVISDEIHAPLVLPGGRHTPYATIEGTADHVTTLLSASKAFNIPGLKCAQIVAGTAADARALTALPPVANHGLSPVGLEANVAAYQDDSPWLDTALEHLAGNCRLFAGALAEHVPAARQRPMEATYLAWVDLRAYGYADPAAVALERGRVMVRDGRDFGPGGAGHVRVNLATSRQRVEELARRLGDAFDPAD
jgi:cysteine-S-conjugate beta-lyase